jgi:hypothetical protein
VFTKSESLEFKVPMVCLATGCVSRPRDGRYVVAGARQTIEPTGCPRDGAGEFMRSHQATRGDELFRQIRRRSRLCGIRCTRGLVLWYLTSDTHGRYQWTRVWALLNGASSARCDGRSPESERWDDRLGIRLRPATQGETITTRLRCI